VRPDIMWNAVATLSQGRFFATLMQSDFAELPVAKSRARA
jgi:hypothetical protein